MREIISLNQGWFFYKTNAVQTCIPTGWEAVTLPHTWNNLDGQDGGNDYWRGTAAYVRNLPHPILGNGGHSVLEFCGAAMSAEVYLNGERLACHDGGYSCFRVDVTDKLQEENTLCVLVDNSENNHVYPQKADFTFYGGLYRDVKLILVPEEHFELLKDGTPGIKVTPVVDIEKRIATVTVETWHNAECVDITVNGQTKTVDRTAEFIIEDVHLWDGLEDPYLYIASARLASGDEISVRFGCRSFSLDAERGFFLNGRSYPLRGVSKHQDRLGKGSAISISDLQEDMELIRELGANTVRLAHYQHAQEFYDMCDENGLIVWAEIPYITKHMPAGRQNTLNQMRELITQCHHHPSIVCWGLSNEITASSCIDEDLLENHRLLNLLCHNMDPTRPTAMAHAFMLDKDSPLIELSDIGSYNLYFGWYIGDTGQNGSFFDEYHTKHPGRVIGFSEYGADANPDYHSAKPAKGDYTEEYQCLYHESLLKCIEERPFLWASHIWNLFDFAADGRDEGGKNGWNQKGLIESDHKTKKDAFYLYKAAWNKKEPFIHLCSKRYVRRTEEVTEIKVYSNQRVVELYADGIRFAKLEGERIFTAKLKLEGTHCIKAWAPETGVSDYMELEKVERFDPTYIYGDKGEVVNWFDQITFTEGYYSIQDTFGALMANPETKPIAGRLMDKAVASRGDVAKSAMQGEALLKMLAGIPFQSLMEQAGEAISVEELRAVNAELQKIPHAQP